MTSAHDCRGTCGPPRWPWTPWCWRTPWWGQSTWSICSRTSSRCPTTPWSPPTPWGSGSPWWTTCPSAVMGWGHFAMPWPLKVRLRSNELTFGFFDFSWRRRLRSRKLQHVDLLPQVKNDLFRPSKFCRPANFPRNYPHCSNFNYAWEDEKKLAVRSGGGQWPPLPRRWKTP